MLSWDKSLISVEDNLYPDVSNSLGDAWADKMGVELPKSFSSLSAGILRGINEIKSSGCLTQSKWSCFEPLSSAKHMIIQRQIALIIGTISGFEHPLQGHTMLVEIIWKDEKKEIMGIEKITPCHSNYLLKKSISSYKMTAKRRRSTVSAAFPGGWWHPQLFSVDPGLFTSTVLCRLLCFLGEDVAGTQKKSLTPLSCL